MRKVHSPSIIPETPKKFSLMIQQILFNFQQITNYQIFIVFRRNSICYCWSFFQKKMIEYIFVIFSNASDEVIMPNYYSICSWRYALLENWKCTWEIFTKLSWQIISVVVLFLLEKSYVFLQNFDKNSLGTIYLFLLVFHSSEKSYVFWYRV